MNQNAHNLDTGINEAVEQAAGLSTFLPGDFTIEAILLRLFAALPSVISQAMLRRRLWRLEQFASQLKETISDVEQRLEPEAFAFLVEKAMRVALEDFRDFKIGMLAAVLRDSLGHDASEISLDRLFIDLIDSLEPYQAAMLRRLAEAQSNPGEADLYVSFDELSSVVHVEEDRADDISRAMSLAGVQMLMSRGLISSRNSPRKKGAIMVGGLNPGGIWIQAQYTLTGVGHRFVEYLGDQ